MDEDDRPSPLPFNLQPRRDEATGQYQSESPELRALRLAQAARGVSPSMISHNLQDVFSLLFPYSDVPAMAETASRQLRTEVTVAGEAMAAWKFAAAKRILSFGWDESTKFGDGVFACNAQIENADGSIEDICLCGLSILPAGG
eukprot:4252886-Prymnesium_polylepis.1